MKTKYVETLKRGDVVKHSRYGVVEVVEVMMCFGSLFGIQLHPKTAEGIGLLRLDSGADFEDVDMILLEDSPRRIAALDQLERSA